MALYTPSGTAPIVAGALARIERRLPVKGEVLVRAGQRVEPEDVVARAFVLGTPQIVNVARALGIVPAQVERVMRREVGNKVTQGEALARSGLMRACPAPVSGIITAVDKETGYITITPDPAKFELQAMVRGIVMDIIPYIGVQIETPAAQAHGIFGFGGSQSGVLRLIVTDPSEPLLPEMIDARSAYAIIIGGSSVNAAALRRAVQEQVRGMIVGSIAEQELRAFFSWPSLSQWNLGRSQWHLPTADQQAPSFTLVVTEGFGDKPMARPIFDLLSDHDRKEALIEGTTALRGPHIRPRVVIPLSVRNANIQINAPQTMLRPGTHVRLLDAEHLGQTGIVRSVSYTPRRLASNVRTATVDVQIDEGGTVVLPHTSVDVLA